MPIARLGAFPSAYRNWLFPVVRQLRAQTRVSFELFETLPHEACAQVAAARLDLAVTIRPPGVDVSPLVRQPLYRDLFALVAPFGLARPNDGSTLSAFADADWVLPGQETYCHEVIISHCARLGFRPRAAARSNDWQSMQEMAALLDAVALVPASCVTPVDGLTIVNAPAPELPVWEIELITRMPVTATPWFTAFRRELPRLLPGEPSRKRPRSRLVGIA